MAFALAATAFGLQRVTSKEPATGTVPTVSSRPEPKATTGVPFRLLLSSPASLVEIDGGQGPRSLEDGGLSGTLDLDQEHPAVSLVVRWKSAPVPGEHRFAKLTLEPSGKASFVHVFDADGDIDDIVELPSTSGK